MTPFAVLGLIASRLLVAAAGASVIDRGLARSSGVPIGRIAVGALLMVGSLIAL